MASLRDLIANNEDWLVERVLSYAKTQGYTAYSSTLESPWRESICGFSDPLLNALEQSDETMELSATADYVNESIADFAIEEARLHRRRGIPLSLFLGLCKYYRQAYLDLILAQGFERDEQERHRLYIERFFDHIEIAFCSEWLAVGDVEMLEETQDQNRRLTNEKNKYLTIFESLNDPVILVDERGEIENLNHAAAGLFCDSDRPGQGYYAQQDYGLLEGQLDELTGAGDDAARFERRLETRQGPRDFEVKSQRMLDVSEKFMGTVLILSDVTEHKRAKQAADAASRAKSTFLATMSHEIRTPITGILGIGRLLKDGPLSENQSEYVSALLSSGEVLLGLVNDVLDYSKIEADAVEVEAVAFELRNLVAQVMSLAGPTAEGKGLAISARVDEAVPNRLSGDAAKIRQILLNLVTNAVKFTDRGSVTVTVERAGETLHVAVADTGIGVAESARATLFEPFTQHALGTAVQAGGTGLGLTICKRLVGGIGGDIGFESEAGVGSTFWFQVPLVEAASHVVCTPLPVDPPALRALRVLLVEDNAVNRLVTEAFLERDGHRVSVVETGEAAIAVLAAQPFDLILMDIRMSGMGGLQTIREIRSLTDPATAGLPILVLTADLATTQAKSCLDAGADDVLGKPFDPASLCQAMARCLTLAEQRRRGETKDILLDEAVIQRHREELGAARARLIVETFCNSTPQSLQTLQEAALAGDGAQVSDLAHALKSAAGNLGLERLRQAAIRVEEAAAAGEQDLAAPVERLSADYEDSLAALRALEVSDQLSA